MLWDYLSVENAEQALGVPALTLKVWMAHVREGKGAPCFWEGRGLSTN